MIVSRPTTFLAGETGPEQTLPLNHDLIRMITKAIEEGIMSSNEGRRLIDKTLMVGPKPAEPTVVESSTERQIVVGKAIK